MVIFVFRVTMYIGFAMDRDRVLVWVTVRFRTGREFSLMVSTWEGFVVISG